MSGGAHKRREELERVIQRKIELAIGAEPDLQLMVNKVKRLPFVTDDGQQIFIEGGLGIGTPDLIGILRRELLDATTIDDLHTVEVGLFFALEVKCPGEVAEEHQAKIHAAWRGMGAFVAVVTSVAEAKTALERARKGAAE